MHVGFLSKLERRFGRFAIVNLMAYIVGAEGVVFLLSRTPQGAAIIGQLQFSAALIAQGEIWRLVSFVFIPPSFSIWVFFILYFYYLLGARLEAEWGSLRFNVYYFSGVAFSVLAALITGEGADALYLNLSIFLAFAAIDPDFSILVFFVIPVKVRYLAWLGWLFIAFTVVFDPLSAKIMAIVSILNYVLFFGPEFLRRLRSQASAYPRRRAFRAQLKDARKTALHRCTLCGVTEQDDPRAEFRFCSQCQGYHEYCLTHLADHQHRQDA